MIIIDSSVWVDYFNGRVTPKTDFLDKLLSEERLLTGDLIVAEVLQGSRSDTDFERAKKLLQTLEFQSMLGWEIALQSAQYYRTLRKRGITVRKTIDVMIGTFCIKHNHWLLHADNDFDPIEQHLGLKVLRP
jgi:predicted nucleic acid-binding protein